MNEPHTMLIGWTVVYVEGGVTWIGAHAPGQGNFAGRVFTKSEAKHRAEQIGEHARVVAVYADPTDPPPE